MPPSRQTSRSDAVLRSQREEADLASLNHIATQSEPPKPGEEDVSLGVLLLTYHHQFDGRVGEYEHKCAYSSIAAGSRSRPPIVRRLSKLQ